MAYATTQDLVDRFGERELIQLTGRPEDDDAFTEVVAARAEQALADASAEIDASLRPRYRVPVADGRGQLVALACDLARYRLMLGGARQPTEQAQQAAQAARSLLMALRKGEAALDLEPAAAHAPAADARLAGPARFASRDSLRDW